MKRNRIEINNFLIRFLVLTLLVMAISCNEKTLISKDVLSSNEKILQTIFKKSTEVFIGDCAWHDSLSDSYGKRCSMPHLHIKADKEMFVKRNMELFAEQEMFLVSIDTVYTADVGNKKVVLVFIEFVPPEFDCRNCEPSIGVAAFIEGEKSNYYNFATFQEHLINYGSYGEITGDYSINNLGGNKFGIKFKKGSMGQGTVEENVVIFVNDEHWYFNEAFSRTTYQSNAGICDTTEIPCKEMKCELKFVNNDDSRYAQLEMKCLKMVNADITEKTLDTFNLCDSSPKLK